MLIVKATRYSEVPGPLRLKNEDGEDFSMSGPGSYTIWASVLYAIVEDSNRVRALLACGDLILLGETNG